MRRKCPKTAKHRAEATWCFHVHTTGCVMEELYSIGLWPIPDTNTQMTIQEVSDRLSRFEDHTFTEGYDSDEEWCDEWKFDFKQVLLDAVKKTSVRGGLCMNCVKKGKIMVADGNCRAKSLETCKGIFE